MGRLLELIDEFPAIRPLLPDIQPSLSSLQSILFFFFSTIFLVHKANRLSAIVFHVWRCSVVSMVIFVLHLIITEIYPL